MTATKTSDEQRCCIVGAGPGGAILALLLARRGVRTTLLEAQGDFDRDFRGDTVHPSTLEMLDAIGLAQKLLEREHVKVHEFALNAGGRRLVITDFRRLRTRFPYIAFLPQAQFLSFIVEEAGRYAGFELKLRARVDELIEEDGVVRGVRYESGGETHELRAALTVAADGRGSRLRKLAGFRSVSNAPPMDVIWLVLPRRPEETADEVVGLYVGRGGRFVVVFGRPGGWQVGYVILKGTVREVREAGLEKLRASLADTVPLLADRVSALKEWTQCHFLNVGSSRIERWHQPGLLLIGDAAHVMSPVGGVGISYAIQDAVAAANLLVEPLLQGEVSEERLASVQKRRELPTRFIQRYQALLQSLIVRRALDDRTPFSLPLPARLITRVPLLRNLPARIVGWGLRPELVRG